MVGKLQKDKFSSSGDLYYFFQLSIPKAYAQTNQDGSSFVAMPVKLVINCAIN